MLKTFRTLLAGGCLAAPLLAQAATPPAPPIDNEFWVSADVGLTRASSFGAVGANLGFYGSQDNVIYGLRHGGSSDFGNTLDCVFSNSGCRDGGDVSETALMLGAYLDPRHRYWAAMGVARVDGFSERDHDRERIEPGLALELVTSPHGSWFGGMFRLSADLNEHNSLVMLSAGIRIGKLR